MFQNPPGSARSEPAHAHGDVGPSTPRSLGSARPHTMGSAWALASRSSLGSKLRAGCSMDLPSTDGFPSGGPSTSSCARNPRSSCRRARGNGGGVLLPGESPEDLSPFAVGTYVVDVCSGRRAFVQGISSSHCKVRFEASTLGGWSDTCDGEGKTEIVPMQRLRVWSERWQGNHRPSSQNPNLKEGLRANENCGVVTTGEHGTKPSSSGGGAQLSPPALPALLVCTAAQQALVPKPPARRVLPVTPRRMFSDSEDEDGSLERWRGHKGAGNAKKDSVKDMIAMDDGEMLLNRFKTVAKARFGGSLGAAWTTVFSFRGTGKVGYLDFVRGGRTLGFTGNYRKLWAALTVNSKPEDGGLIGFEALDPHGAKILEQFRTFFIEKGVETLDDLWEQYMDQDGSGRCLREEFLTIMCTLGWSRKVAKQLFRMLDVGGQQDISLDELETVGLPRREIAKNLTGKEILRIQEQEARDRVLSDFHGYLIKTFGGVVRAWRLGLDADGDGKLRFNEFCNAVKEIGFRGALQTLWRALDKNKVGYIELGDMDPEAKDCLDEFRSFLEENYLTLDDVWERVFDVQRSGRCSLENFVSACHDKLQWPGNARKMFRWLDLHSRNILTIDQFEFIGMRRRKEKAKGAKEKIAERQAKDRAEAQAMLGRFKDYLSQRYGNLVRAWRLVLDPDGDKRLQFTEFCASCRKIAFQGNLKALWMALDQNDTGIVSMDALDLEAVEHLEDFKLLLMTYFENLDVAWYGALDPDLSGRCTFEEFRECCQFLGFRRNIKNLFKYLDIRGDENGGFLELDMLDVLDLPRAADRDSAMRSSKESREKDLDDLKSMLKVRFGGNLVHAWRKGFCRSGVEGQFSEKLSLEDFVSTCRTLGFEGNFPKIWADLMLPESACSDLRSFVLEYPRGPTTARQPLQQRSSTVSFDAPSEPDSPSSGPSSEQGGRKASMKKRSSTVSFDAPSEPDSPSGPSTEQGGRKASMKKKRQSIQAQAKAKRLQIEALGSVTLRQLDSEAYEALSTFRTLCEKSFGTHEDTWKALLKQCLETNFNARLWKVEFSQAAHMIGFTGDAAVVFAACDAESENRISAENVRFLQIGSGDV